MKQNFLNGSVVCDLNSSEKYSAIHELLSKAPVFRDIQNLSSFEQVVIEREKKLSTGLGHGVAFAHGKTDKVDSIYIALGISQEGIEYDALDDKPVHLLFIVANPVIGHQEYLQLIAKLSRILRIDDFREKILHMKDEKEIETLFRRTLESIEVKC